MASEPRPVARATSSTSRNRLDNRRDAYSPNKLKQPCHTNPKTRKIAKFPSLIRIEKNWVSETALLACKKGRLAATKATINKPISNSLKSFRNKCLRAVLI